MFTNRYRPLLEAVMDDAVTSGASAQDEPAAVQSPADEYIPTDDFPWEGPQAKSSESDAADKPDPDASTGESAPDGQPVELTEEEKLLDEQLKELQVAQPGKTPPNYLRKVATGAIRGRKEAEAKATDLEQQLEAERGVPFRPTVPADEFKARDFNGELAEKHPGYYGPIVVDILQTHLDPAMIARDPQYIEPVLPVLESIFLNRWFPDFVQKTYGMDVQAFAQMVDGNLQSPGQAAQPANSSTQQLIEKYQLDPNAHPDLIASLQAADQTSRQLAQLQRTVQQLQAAQGDGTKQQVETQAAARVQEFDSMVVSDRQRLRDDVLKTLPRDQQGAIHKEFAHLPAQIDDLVEAALNRDANYTAARDHARKWFKQPGTAETARQLAGGDLKKVYGLHQATYTRIADAALKPYESLINAHKQISRDQRARQQPKGGSSIEDLPQRQPTQGNGQRPRALRDYAQENYRNSGRA